MRTTLHEVADAIRDVTAKVQQAIEDGHRSRQIDADDLVELLLAVADKIDPPMPNTPPSVLAAASALLEARENQMVTHLEWDRLAEAVRQTTPPNG